MFACSFLFEIFPHEARGHVQRSDGSGFSRKEVPLLRKRPGPVSMFLGGVSPKNQECSPSCSQEFTMKNPYFVYFTR